MLGRIGRRAIDLAVLFFAILGFVYVPLGERSGWEHLKALLGSEPARQAGEELVEAGGRLKRHVTEDPEPIELRGEPVLPALPKPKGELELLRATPGHRDTPDAGPARVDPRPDASLSTGPATQVSAP